MEEKCCLNMCSESCLYELEFCVLGNESRCNGRCLAWPGPSAHKAPTIPLQMNAQLDLVSIGDSTADIGSLIKRGGHLNISSKSGNDGDVLIQ